MAHRSIGLGGGGKHSRQPSTRRALKVLLSDRVSDIQAFQSNFAQAEQHDYVIKHPTTDQGVVDRALSKSYITAQPPEEQAKIEKGIRELLKSSGGRVWIDEAAGSYEYPYRTSLYLMKKIS